MEKWSTNTKRYGNDCLWFDFEKFFPSSLLGSISPFTCTSNGLYSFTPSSCSWSQFSEFNIVQPISPIQICTVDLLEREAYLTNVTVEFVIYESYGSSITSLYSK